MGGQGHPTPKPHSIHRHTWKVPKHSFFHFSISSPLQTDQWADQQTDKVSYRVNSIMDVLFRFGILFFRLWLNCNERNGCHCDCCKMNLYLQRYCINWDTNLTVIYSIWNNWLVKLIFRGLLIWYPLSYNMLMRLVHSLVSFLRKLSMHKMAKKRLKDKA